MRLQKHPLRAEGKITSLENSSPSLYSAAKSILKDYINLWKRKEATGNAYVISPANMNKVPGCAGDTTYICLLRMMEAGLLSGIKSLEMAVGIEVRFSFEVIAIIVERSFDFPHETPDETIEAILAHFMTPLTTRLTAL